MALLKAYTYITEDVNFGMANFVDVVHNLGTTTGIALAGQKIIITPRNIGAGQGTYLSNVTLDGFRINSVAPNSVLVRVQVEAVHSIQQ